MSTTPVKDQSTGIATLIYCIYLVALFTGFPFFIGVLIAYFAKGGAGPAARSHYEHQIGIFWRVLIGGIIISGLFLVSLVLMWVLVGFILWPLVAILFAYYWIWTLVRCIRGLRTAGGEQAYTGPYGWAI